MGQWICKMPSTQSMLNKYKFMYAVTLFLSRSEMLRFCKWWSFWSVCQDGIQLGISISWRVAHCNQLYLSIGFWALVYFSYTEFIENSDIPCQNTMWPHQSFKKSCLLACLKDRFPWDHQGWDKGTWLGLGGRWTNTEGQYPWVGLIMGIN